VATDQTMPRLIFHPAYLDYDLGPEHPFSPVRIEMVVDLLAELGVRPEFAAPEPVAVEELFEVHDEDYVRVVEAASAGTPCSDIAAFGLGTPDNPVVPGMAEAARWLVGGTVDGAELIAQGRTELALQLGGGFHHARRRLASGFCLYNDVALAIRRLNHAGFSVAYIDVDVHHCDGVQEILLTDERVITLSLHESGEYLFPGTGWLHELGQGMGRGLRLNVPLEPFTEGANYLETLEEVGGAVLDYFHPDVLVVQAGADAHYLDPLADLMLTTRDFERVFRVVLDLAQRTVQKRALLTLGGGYSLNATPRVWTILALLVLGLPLPDELPTDWRRRWEQRLSVSLPTRLHDPADAYDAIPRRSEIDRQNRGQVQRLLDAVAPLWL
jgi:acetoin utilization protein AcuC